jgi:mannose-1-phosphate guanylyltransferase
MNAVVLVGGLGTRLRPLTYSVAKPLIPIVNRPLVGHILANLQRHGVQRVVLAASAGDRSIEHAIGDGAAYGLEVGYSYETEPLGSGLAVKLAARDFDGAFFVCNGDVVTNLDLSAMARLHEKHSAILSIFLAGVDDPSGYGIADLGEDDRIVRFVEKPSRTEAPSNWANAGTWIFDPAMLDHISDERMDRSLEQLVFPALIAEGLRVQGFCSPAYWMDVGTSERYTQLHADILEGRVPECLPGDVSGQALIGEHNEISPSAAIGPLVITGPLCRVEDDAQVTGPSVLGRACFLGRGARFESSVAWDAVLIGAGAVVRGSVLGTGCSIGAGAVVEDAVLANEVRVGDGVHLSRGSRLEPGEVAS